MAAAYGRLEFSARLRRQGREAGGILQGQRSVPAEALAQDLDGGRQAGGSGFCGGLSGTHAAAPDLRAGEGDNRVEYAAVDPAGAGAAGDSRPDIEAGQGDRAEGGRAGAAVEQQSDKP